jgi:FkbM family methyltransferase
MGTRSLEDEDVNQVQHHPAITAHDAVIGPRSNGFDCDFLGVRTRRSFVSAMAGHVPDVAPAVTYPSFDEEYFEWIDILEAVEQADETFVMIELGAGYGRWCARAAAAVRRKPNCQFQCVAVEAEPAHFRWIHDHFRDNDIDPREHDLIWAAVGARPGFVPFWVGAADGWYGQAIAVTGEKPPLPNVSARRRLRARSALGRPPVVASNDRSVTWIPCVTLADVIAPYPRVDLIDLDVQGAEYDVLASAIDLVNARVRRLHIGTHAPQIERQLRELFTSHNWQLVNDYPGQSSSQTPYGPILFGDGVQTWVNPAAPVVPAAVARSVQSPRKSAADDGKALRSLRSRITELKQQNRALKRRNAELRERTRARDEQVRDLLRSRWWPLRLVENWVSKRRRS